MRRPASLSTDTEKAGTTLLASAPPGDDPSDVTAHQPMSDGPNRRDETQAPESTTPALMTDTTTSRADAGPLDRPTMSVMEAADLLGISREAGYDGVRRGDIPSIRIGRAIRIPSAKLAAMLGIAVDGQAGSAADER